MGRCLSQKEMSAARFEEEVLNSRLKRGEIENPEHIRRSFHVVCGCGAEGCMFIAHIRREQNVQEQPDYVKVSF